MKSFAIIGISGFGYFLAKYLAEMGHGILAIDVDEEKIERVKPFVQKAIIADVRDKNTLTKLGLSDYDSVFVCLRESLDASVLVTLYLRELGVKQIVAKAMTEDHGKILDMLGATRVIFPERDEAYRLAATMESAYLLDAFPLGDGISMIEMAPPKKFVGKTLAELDLRNKFGILVLVIKEIIPKNIVKIPAADQVLKDSDTLVLLGHDDDLKKIQHQ